MKTMFKIMIIFFTIFISVYPSDRKVLVEIFTNSACPFCPPAHTALDNYLQNSPNANKIAYIYYNIRYPYASDQLYKDNTTDSDAKYKLYLNSSGGNPAAFFDGKRYANSFSSWGSTLDNLETQASSFDIKLKGNYTSSNFTVNAEITKTGETTDADLTVNYVVVENVEYSGGNGITNHKHVMRKIANIDGDPLTIEVNETKEMSSTFNMNDIWNKSNLGIVVFIQSKSTKTVYQSEYISYSDLTLTSVDDKPNLSEKFQLHQNYPNPFNPTTKISWQTPVAGFQTLKVYDILGNEVATLVNEYKPAGKYEVTFNANNQTKGQLPSGFYIYQLKVGNYIQTRKMILLK